MTETQNEKSFEHYKELLSCLSDGELSEFEVKDLLQALPNFPELRSYWFRLQLKSNVLKKQSVFSSENLQWVEKVIEALHLEAPHVGMPPQEANIVSFSKTKKTFAKERFSQFTNFAIAASVMLMVTAAWLGSQAEFRQVALAYFSPQSSEILNNEFAHNQNMQADIQANNKVLVSVGNVSSEASERVNDLFLSDNRIDQYMLLHAENASLNTNHGMLPFARMNKISTGKQF